MAAPKPLENKREKLLEDVNDFLRARGGRIECTVCHSSDISAHYEWYYKGDQYLSYGLSIFSKPKEPPVSISPTLMRLCQNCGNIMLMNVNHFTSWLKEYGR